MQRRWWKLAVVFVVAGLIVPLIGCAKEATPEALPYKIGLLASVSGYTGPVGKGEKQAWLLAIEDINAEGGINGHLLEAVVYDDESDEGKAALLAKKMISEDKVLTIGKGETASVCMAAKSVTEGDGVPLLIGTGEIRLTLPPREWSFAHVPDQCGQCGSFYGFCRTRGFTKAAYLGDSTSMGKGARDVLEKTALDIGISIVDFEEYDPGDVDMVPQLMKIKAAAPQILWIQGFSMASVLACEQAKALRLDIPIFVMVPTIDPSFVKTKPEALEGVITVSTKGMVYWTLPADDPMRVLNERIATELMQKYGRDIGPRDPAMYDNVLIVAEALRIAGLTNEDLADVKEARTKVRDAMEQINIVGAFDSYQFDEAHRTVYPIRDRAIITIKNGQRTFVQTTPGGTWAEVLDLYLKRIGGT